MQTILVLDFGGQYKELIARRVREHNVYSVVKNGGKITAEEVTALAPAGIILTGGPNSVYDEKAPKCDPKILKLGVPTLGVCYGMQLLCYTTGGIVSSAKQSEYGKVTADFSRAGKSKLLAGVKKTSDVLMSHTDNVAKLPAGFTATAATPNCPVAACEDAERKLYAVQFHPETDITEDGALILKSFLYNICGCRGDYLLDDYLTRQIDAVKKKVGSEKIILALSGGVDSSVTAALLTRALPGQVTCVFVDHGLMRLDEGNQIEEVFRARDLEFVRVNAEERYLSKLKGVSDPETKRKIIGKEFIEVFSEEAARRGDIKFLAQGTIYPDIIESGGGDNTATIKSHHNVGGLPKDLKFTLVEPLNQLFKDEVRKLGVKLGLPESLVYRQPFPGPGLAVRIIGDITKEKADILRRADDIFCREVETLPKDKRPSQYCAIFTGLKSVGVRGDFRGYDYVIALRAVNTTDFMTASYTHLPHEILERAAARIVNEVAGVGRVVYDITSKPPASIEWE